MNQVVAIDIECLKRSTVLYMFVSSTTRVVYDRPCHTTHNNMRYKNNRTVLISGGLIVRQGSALARSRLTIVRIRKRKDGQVGAGQERNKQHVREREKERHWRTGSCNKSHWPKKLQENSRKLL